MRFTCLFDRKFAIRQFLLTQELGYDRPRRIRRLSRNRSRFFKIRMKCVELVEQKRFNHSFFKTH